MEIFQVVILAVVQGLTEFLPVSSSAHLILVPIFSGWSDQGIAFDIAIHVGSLIAVIVYFNRELRVMLHDWAESLWTRRSTVNSRLTWAVILGTIPVGLAGLTFKSLIASEMRSPLIMASGLIGFGILLSWSDWRHSGSRSECEMTWKDVFVIGCAQAFALIPGTSRSGITMTAALIMGFNRESATRFSFLLSIPVIMLAGGLEVISLIRNEISVPWDTIVIGTTLAAISAYACIHYFLAFIKRIGMQPFVIYRLLLGTALLYVFWPR